MKKLLFIVFLIPSLSFAVLNRTYPTSATTKIRMDMVVDSIRTIYLSTATEFTRWNDDGTTTNFSLSTATIDAIKFKLVEELIDKDLEQYFVWYSSYLPVGMTWKGFCNQIENGRLVAGDCP